MLMVARLGPFYKRALAGLMPFYAVVCQVPRWLGSSSPACRRTDTSAGTRRVLLTAGAGGAQDVAM